MGQESVIRLELPNQFKNELVAEAVARQIAQLAGFSDDQIEEIETALGEACLNAIEHSKIRNVPIRVIFSFKHDHLEVIVEDNGVGFRREEVDLPSIGDKLKAVYKRGWGLMLMEQLMDEIRISPLDPQGTRIHMKKYKTSEQSDETGD